MCNQENSPKISGWNAYNVCSRLFKNDSQFSQLALDAKVMGSWRTLSGFFLESGYRHR